MKIEWRKNLGDTPVLSFSGALNFNAERRLLDLLAAEHLPSTPTTIVADLQRVDAMDSSALGMLLILREKIERFGHQVRLHNCSPAALEKLRVAQFHTIFEIAA